MAIRIGGNVGVTRLLDNHEVCLKDMVELPRAPVVGNARGNRDRWSRGVVG